MPTRTKREEMDRFREILEREEIELVQVLQARGSIAVERRPDLIDAIQDAAERDLTIQNADHECHLLREVRTALRRIHDSSFGTCTECERVISPKRLAALPWASRCVQCQEAADQDSPSKTALLDRSLVNVA